MVDDAIVPVCVMVLDGSLHGNLSDRHVRETSETEELPNSDKRINIPKQGRGCALIWSRETVITRPDVT